MATDPREEAEREELLEKLVALLAPRGSKPGRFWDEARRLLSSYERKVREEERERAAKVCERLMDDHIAATSRCYESADEGGAVHHNGAVDGCARCAAALRADVCGVLSPEEER